MTAFQPKPFAIDVVEEALNDVRAYP